MRMTLLGTVPSAVPFSVIGGANVDHIVDAGGEVVPLFDNGAPSAPDRRGSGLVQGEGVSEGLQIFPVQILVIDLFHVIRIGGPLGVDVEHNEAVVAIVEGHPLHGLEGVVQVVWGGGGGVDAYADQGLFSPCAQNVTVFRVDVGDI